MKKQIGIATLIMSSHGLVLEAKFTPTMELKACEQLVGQLRLMPDGTDLEKAQLVFSSWFSKMNEMEMAENSRITVDEGNLQTEGTNRLVNTFTFYLESADEAVSELA